VKSKVSPLPAPESAVWATKREYAVRIRHSVRLGKAFLREGLPHVKRSGVQSGKVIIPVAKADEWLMNRYERRGTKVRKTRKEAA